MYFSKSFAAALVAAVAMASSVTAESAGQEAQQMNAHAARQVDRAVMNQLIRYYVYTHPSRGLFGSLGDAIGDIVGSVGDLGKGILGGVANVGDRVLTGAAGVTNEALRGVGNIGDGVLDDAGNIVHQILH
ncbi:hypothetical protein H4219_006328 [Mycoemilia scoparia]|uniref:Uncharacterized protein n=1 Tax=Mycoemilia scoparia TaxID=417184 RepID=A0A9W7ZT42_9FUNG|nr:hypothetical protein H4219_006328 [Mycoemilia scoparia]